MYPSMHAYSYWSSMVLISISHVSFLLLQQPAWGLMETSYGYNLAYLHVYNVH